MTDTPELRKSSRIQKIKRYASEGKLVFSSYLSLDRKLEDIRARPVPEEVVNAYNENEELISTLFASQNQDNLLFHGTGAHQYEGDKYRSGVGDDLRNPLDAILENGIVPHHDAWNSSKGGYESSSLATAWSYAKVYADFHQTKDNPLQWEYGDKADWLSYVMGATIISQGKDKVKKGVKSPREILRKFRDMKADMRANKPVEGFNRLQRWVSYVRKPNKEDTTKDIFSSRSDILGNYGAVFVVDRQGVNIAPKGPGVYEVRTLDSVSPDHFLALAVPIDKIEEAERKVFQAELDLPVLPTEAIEYYMSKLPFDTLIKNRKIPASLKPQMK